MIQLRERPQAPHTSHFPTFHDVRKVTKHPDGTLTVTPELDQRKARFIVENLRARGIGPRYAHQSSPWGGIRDNKRVATLAKAYESPNAPVNFADDPRDPRVLGYDRLFYDALGIATQEATSNAWAASGTGSTQLSRNRVITALVLSADPFVDTVTTGTTVVVQDGVDRALSGFAVVGGPTYMNLSGTPAYLKHWGNQNKVVFPSVIRQELVTTVSASNSTTAEWYIPFGVFDDLDPYDCSSGIPAEDETSLNANLTFAANSLIGVTAANHQITTATTFYIVSFGVQGMPPTYRARMPIPDFRFDSNTAPTATTIFNLLTQRYLKRTTILNLAVSASNNEPRNDGNITSVSVIFNKPTLTKLFDTIRWMTFQNAILPTDRLSPVVDKDFTNTTLGRGLAGVGVIDWRKFTHNPWGLNLYPFQLGDVQISFAMGTTTGSIHLFHEYYAMPDPRVALGWPAYVPLS